MIVGNFLVVFFFFQAEDGIRDGTVTGVQTCALPIFAHSDDMFPTSIVRVTEEEFWDIRHLARSAKKDFNTALTEETQRAQRSRRGKIMVWERPGGASWGRRIRRSGGGFP